MPDDETRGLRWALVTGIVGVIVAGLAVAMGWLAMNIVHDDGTQAAAQVGYQPGDFRTREKLSADFKELAPIAIANFAPSALTVSPEGKILLAGTGRLVGLDVAGKPMREVELAAGAEPTCLAVGENGTMYVGYAGSVAKVAPDGKRMEFAKFADPNTRLTSLAVGEKVLYAADAGSKCIHCLALADGKETMKIGGGKNEFIIPSPYFDVAIGTDGSLWAANTGKHTLENYAADGALRSSWQRVGLDVAGFCGCCNPIHFAILPDGSFLTAEKGVPRVKICGPDGNFRALVAGPDQFDDGAIPGDVAALPDGRVLVLDQARKQVRVFQKK